MKLQFLLFAAFFFGAGQVSAQEKANNTRFVLVIHGGAGTILKSTMTPEKEQKYKEALTLALQKGYDTLSKGASALDAVQTAVMVLEDSPLFNAGKGAVFTNKGVNEMDAAIMNGQNLAAGSVAGITTVKNPVTAARAVMEKSEHVMLSGKGAEEFARLAGCTIVKPAYFFTPERWNGLKKAQEKEKADSMLKKNKTADIPSTYPFHDQKFGTVGAVALDKNGNLAAATSTGGMTNKRYGRIGDAPVIGAGTYASNNTCAVSCTGWGEYFIRLVMAKSVSDLVEYKGLSIADATQEMIMNKLPKLGGDGGLIAVDKNGNIAMPFNTEGMYRGSVKEGGKIEVAIYKGNE
jgi:L-asparaginase / beta-aspartyl-peptidase